MLNYLETNSLDEEGLLRVPGSSVRINALQQELETNYNNSSDSCPFEGFKSTDVCSLLKLFIRYKRTHATCHMHVHPHIHSPIMLNCICYMIVVVPHDGMTGHEEQLRSTHIHTLVNTTGQLVYAYTLEKYTHNTQVVWGKLINICTYCFLFGNFQRSSLSTADQGAPDDLCQHS